MFKYKILFLFIILLFIVYNVRAYVIEAPLFGKVIYIDPGHGGVDPGAYYKNTYEDVINLEISLKLKDKIESLGGTVYLTREGDYDVANPNAYLRKRSDLSNRANMINESNANIYLSIHLNASVSTNWRGAQAFYDDINSNNKEIAETFQKYFNKHLNSKRSAKEIKTLYMYKKTNVPGVLLEVGFISNENERYILKQKWYQEKIVNTICKGLQDILL